MDNKKNTKSVAIMQPYLFPYIGYFQLIKAVDIFVIYDDVNYINKGYINRNTILLHDKPHKFTLALSGASQNKLINQIQIGSNAKKILKTIEMSYKRAPFFREIFPTLKNIMLNDEKNLAKFVGNSLQRISNGLDLKTIFIYSSEIEKDNTLASPCKIIDICKKLGATTYINAIGGQKFYDKFLFKQKNINLFFLKTLQQQYKQFKSEFTPNLSIIDILMFNMRLSTIKMLDQYELI